MKKIIIYLLVVSITLFSACSTDLDVTGTYKETMVVYGLLDQSQTKQYIKINKAFLGEGDAFTYAQLKDSTQYASVLSVKLKRVSDGSEFNLAPDNSIPKEPGAFYYPDQANALYSFSSAPGMLNPSSNYKLIIKNTETGTEVSATTSLINDFLNFTSPNVSSPAFSFIVVNNPNYPFHVIWNSGKNARTYQLIARFNYTEYMNNGDINAKSMDWVSPEIKTQDVVGGELMTIDIIGQDYLRFIGDQLQNDNPAAQLNITKRVAGKVDLIMIAAGDELNTFMEVNKPSTGIIQQKPEYTNITNGLGVFSSRFYRSPLSKPFNTTTLTELQTGQYTKNLKFQ